MNRNYQKHPGYYEAILQLRPAKEELIKFVLEEFKRRPDVFISKQVDLKNGVDLYISSNQFTKHLGIKLSRKFPNSEMKTSRALYSRSRMTSKLLYRVTVLFRLKE